MNRQIIAKLLFLAVVMVAAGCSTPASDKTVSAAPVSGHKETAFSRYDKKFIRAVQSHWYDLLDRTGKKVPKGEVVLKFRLHANGGISDMAVIKNTVGEISWANLCESAVLDPAPYSQWPVEMSKAAHRTYREITFTFYYELEPHGSESE